MAQKKGQTGNPHGRPRGSRNKATFDMKERIRQFVETEFNGVVADFNKLDAKDRVLLFERFLAYVMPKQKEIAADVTVKQSPLSEMTREEIMAEIERIKKIRNDK